jgi:hypothetical protein
VSLGARGTKNEQRNSELRTKNYDEARRTERTGSWFLVLVLGSVVGSSFFVLYGQVAERSIAADCKSAAPRATEVRILPCPFIQTGVGGGLGRRHIRAQSQRARTSGLGRGSPSEARCEDQQRPARVVRAKRQGARTSSGPARRSPSRALECKDEGGSNSVVESQPSKLLVAGSIPVSRSILRSRPEPLPRATDGRPTFAREVDDAGRCPSGGRRKSRLVGRSAEGAKADVAQLAERVLGKDEVTSSILVIGSNLRSGYSRRLPTSARVKQASDVGRRLRG